MTTRSTSSAAQIPGPQQGWAGASKAMSWAKIPCLFAYVLVASTFRAFGFEVTYLVGERFVTGDRKHIADVARGRSARNRLRISPGETTKVRSRAMAHGEKGLRMAETL